MYLYKVRNRNRPWIYGAVAVGLAAVTAGCSGGSGNEPQAAPGAVVVASTAPVTTTAPVPTTTTTEAPTTTTTENPEAVWVNAMLGVSTRMADINKASQLDDSVAQCRRSVVAYSGIVVPAAPAKYLLAAKYERNAIDSLKQANQYCVSGDVDYQLDYLRMGNQWLQLASNNL